MNIRDLAKPGLALGLTLAATLFPAAEPSVPDPCGAFDVLCGPTRAVDFILNVLLFIPLGATGRALLGRAGRTVVAAACVSIMIEVLQGTVIPGRDPSARDVISNTAGAAIGAGLVLLWPHLGRPSRATAAVTTVGLAAALAATFLAGAALLRPSIPASMWFGQHQAALEGLDRFPGTLIAATLAGSPLPSGLLRPVEAHRVAEGGGIDVGATVLPPTTPTARLAPIVSIFDAEQRKIVIVGQLGRSLAFTPRLRGEDWGFEAVVVRFPDIQLTSADGTVRLATAYRGGVITAKATWAGRSGNPEFERRQALGPADWWRLLVPWTVALSSGTAQGLSALGLLLSLVPLGWFGRRWADAGGPAAGALIAAVLPAAVALWPVPLGYPASSLPLWLGAGAGWAAGWLLARRGQAVVRTAPRRSGRAV